MSQAQTQFERASITTELIQKYLDENKQLILAILDNQNLGKMQECAQYQSRLQSNLMYLAAIADAQPPAPPQQQQQQQAYAPPTFPPSQPRPASQGFPSQGMSQQAGMSAHSHPQGSNQQIEAQGGGEGLGVGVGAGGQGLGNDSSAHGNLEGAARPGNQSNIIEQEK